MKKLIAALLFITPCAFAENISVKFDQIPVTQLLQATYKNILGKSYGIDASVLTNNRKVTLDINDLPIDRLVSTVDAVLAQAGINKYESSDGVVYFTQNKTAFNAEPSPADRPADGPDEDLTQLELPPVPFGVVQQDQYSVGSLPPFPKGQIPENFTLFRANHRPTSVLQPIANTLLGVQYPVGDFVFLSGDDKAVEKARFLLEQLDQPTGEIFARAMILEFRTEQTRGNTFEFALSALSGNLKIGLGSLLPAGENFIKFSGADFSAVLSAVSGDSRFKVVSVPTLRVKDGATGRVSVGEEVPTLSSTALDNQGNAQQSIQYRSSGVIFEIKPTVLKKSIVIDLKQQISDFAKTGTSGIDSPTLSKRELSSVISVDPGELIVLGGLDQNRDRDSTRGFSFLPDFMRGNSSEKSSTQIVVVLQVQRVM
jgi:type II secretory pathway component GspD/PulD (secretin)